MTDKNDNIIFVMPSFSCDGKKGYEKLTLQWISSLQSIKNIHVLNIGSYEDSLIYNKQHNITIHNRKISLFQSILNCFTALFQLKPIQTNFLKTIDSKKYLAKLIQDLSPEKIVFVTIRTHNLSHKIPKSKKIMLAVDSMTLNFFGKYKNSSYFKKFIFWIEYILLTLKESKILNQYSRVVFVARRDALIYEDLNIDIIPLSITMPSFTEPSFHSNCTLLFTGNMDYEPNRTAIKWFYNNVWLPYDLGISEHMKLVVCGRGAKDWNFLRSKKDIEIRSDVKDIYKEIIECEIYIAPMQSGSGMQYKIIEAMACSRPIVTTSPGVGSILLDHNNEKLLIADTAEAMYEAILKLHADINLRKQLGHAARSYVSHNYSHDEVAKKVNYLFK